MKMKKGIEWLVQTINTERKSLRQRFESGKETADESAFNDGKDNALTFVLRLIEHLDEPEVLSQEWVDNNKEPFHHFETKKVDYYVSTDFLQNLLVPTISEMETVDITVGHFMDWLDDNEFYHHATAETVLANAVNKGKLGYYGTKYSVVKKPVIPKYVGDWIKGNKEWYDNIFFIGYDICNNDIQPDVDDWIMANEEEFVRAWLKGYEVEEESLYYALVKGHELVTDEGDIACKYWNLRVPTGDVFPSNRYSRRGEFVVKMSKSEWNKLGINDSNADFVEVDGY